MIGLQTGAMSSDPVLIHCHEAKQLNMMVVCLSYPYTDVCFKSAVTQNFPQVLWKQNPQAHNLVGLEPMTFAVLDDVQLVFLPIHRCVVSAVYSVLSPGTVGTKYTGIGLLLGQDSNPRPSHSREFQSYYSATKLAMQCRSCMYMQGQCKSYDFMVLAANKVYLIDLQLVEYSLMVKKIQNWYFSEK